MKPDSERKTLSFIMAEYSPGDKIMISVKSFDDLLTATRYLHRKLASTTWPDRSTHNDARKAFPPSTKLNKTTLNTWCGQWLSDPQRQKLAAAVRSARKRRRNPDTKTITLTTSAHSKLARIARREAVTLSEAVEQCLK